MSSVFAGLLPANSAVASLGRQMYDALYVQPRDGKWLDRVGSGDLIIIMKLST